VFQANERRNEHKNGALRAGKTEKPVPGKWKMENAGECEMSGCNHRNCICR